MNSKDKYNLIRLGRKVFPTRPHWEVEALQAQGLPLYWNKEWLAGELRRLGSARRLAQEWGYPWGEVARFARQFGLAAPGHRPWKATFVMLDKDLVKEMDQASKAAGVSRNRWIVQALEEYLAHEDAAKAQGGSRLTN